ncbi:toxic anion resistance protein [Stenotrophomonas maltophilia]|uniref:Toxic anion resistance protein n=1 Tax=Stenotrophomonas maltophilia TaxID=40324 RepID=A0AB34TGS7_STEMA|nr:MULTISPECIES: toxic anion resistance protein [Stenotrophomonas]KOO81993.1 toxic anion resistance protein [Stenotrophomonas maltophilia]MBH1540362.1 toxic anion resistance protein [Stenotrophomonas maltophilia]MBN4981761.1 toxic anion resistance protein [Stenotrophomonas maltophilia]MDZ7474767.1 toxic anion resistance protein [Stenotrophomonas pavanii]
MTQDSQTPGALVPGTTTAAPLDEGVLQALGLVREDLPRIAEIRLELDDLRPGNLQVFGREAATRTAAFSSQLLDQVRNRDLDASGEKLGEVVRIARSLKLDGFAQRSKVPVIGGLIDRLRVSKGELVQKFSDTNAQIEQLLGDVGVQQALMGKRVGEFDRMHDIVREERHALGLYAAAGKQRLAELQAEQGSEDPQQRIRQGEVDNAIRLLEKRVSDLQLMQHAADQSLPMIRLIQANALQLIEKFNTVREITIPSWKRQFAIQLSLGEQKAAVELSTAIDDATNELMRRNADLLRQASVDTARSNQRGVIDVATLRHVHDQLIATVEEVRSIHREGMQQRQQAEVELSRLREDLQQRLATPTAS